MIKQERRLPEMAAAVLAPSHAFRLTLEWRSLALRCPMANKI